MLDSKREIKDRKSIDSFINECAVVSIGMISQGEPYVVPVNFVYEGGTVYFHCSCSGRKMKALSGGGEVCLEFHTMHGIDIACADTFYTSVIGWGVPVVLESPDRKRRVLEMLCERFLEKKRKITDNMLTGTCIVGIHLHRVTGKENRG